jgi:hypothetical protein
MNARMPSSIIDAADHLDHAARQDRPFTHYEKTRLHLAGQIAAGLCANPHVFEMRGWQGEVARDSLSMADKILLVHMTGGC